MTHPFETENECSIAHRTLWIVCLAALQCAPDASDLSADPMIDDPSCESGDKCDKTATETNWADMILWREVYRGCDHFVPLAPDHGYEFADFDVETWPHYACLNAAEVYRGTPSTYGAREVYGVMAPLREIHQTFNSEDIEGKIAVDSTSWFDFTVEDLTRKPNPEHLAQIQYWSDSVFIDDPPAEPIATEWRNIGEILSIKGKTRVDAISAPHLRMVGGPLRIGSLYDHYLTHGGALEKISGVQIVDFPSLATVLGSILIEDMPLLAEIAWPELHYVKFGIEIVGNSKLFPYQLARTVEARGAKGEQYDLTAIDLPKLTHIGRDLVINRNPGLRRVSIPNLERVNGNVFITHGQMDSLAALNLNWDHVNIAGKLSIANIDTLDMGEVCELAKRLHQNGQVAAYYMLHVGGRSDSCYSD